MPSHPDLPRLAAALLAALLLAGCGTLNAPRATAPATGGTADVPAPPRVPDTLPAPVAPVEPAPREAGAAPALPPALQTPAVETGIASWYGRRFHGRRTASGERFDMHALTAAHPSLPFGTRVRVHNPANRREVVVRINDRGPFKRGRIVDLSLAAAKQLGIAGLATVELQPLADTDLSAAR